MEEENEKEEVGEDCTWSKRWKRRCLEKEVPGGREVEREVCGGKCGMREVL